jgi:accessory gene regulator B
MDTYGKCIATSTMLYIGAGVFSQYTYIYWNILQLFSLLIIVSMISTFAIVKWAPKDTPNKPITKSEEIAKYKRLSIIYIVSWTLICGLLLYYGYTRSIVYTNLIVISSSMGVLLEIFLITPVGYRVFERLSGQKSGI